MSKKMTKLTTLERANLVLSGIIGLALTILCWFWVLKKVDLTSLPMVITLPLIVPVVISLSFIIAGVIGEWEHV